MNTDKISRDDLALYTMGAYDGDAAALEARLGEDEGARAMLAEEAELELLLRDAAAAGTFCANCDDLIPDTKEPVRCGSCGAAIAPGGYTVESVLVANAHGRMYIARDADGTRVALKELAFVQSPSSDSLAAFEREAKFLRALAHSAIPRFRAAFEEGAGVHTRYYLAQELVEGTPLDARFDEHFYTEAEIIDIARQVLVVLVYLQSLSPMVIHRDIKPANLLRRADGSIAVVDFGAAHVQGTTAGSTSIGTFGYMPLEQLAGQVDATTDCYALGASLVHLLTRREPWRILTPTTLGPVNVSPALNAFLQKLVSAEPKDRFANAAAALAGLDNLGKEPVAIIPTRKKPRLQLSMNSVAWPIALVLVAAIFGTYATMRSAMHQPVAPRAAIETQRSPGETVDTTGPSPASPAATRGVVASGYIAAKAPIVLAVNAGSRIAKLNVENGDRVTKGQIVAVLEDASLQADIEVANAHLRDVSRALQSKQHARAIDAATRAEVESATGAVEIAAAEVHAISQKIEATKIRSPVDGTVLEVLARPGEAVAVGDGSTAGIMRIADLSELVAETDVAEADLKGIAVDQYAEVTTDSVRDTPYLARVREISHMADKARGTVLVRAYLDTSSNAGLKPGMAVQVRFLGDAPPPRKAPDVPAPARWTSDAVIDIRSEKMGLEQLLVDISKGCKLAIVIPDYVKSTVGTTMGEVPCSSAFETFLASASLDYRYEGGIARVGTRHELAQYDIEAVEHAAILARLGKKLELLPAGPTMNLDYRGFPLPTLLQTIAKVGNVKLVLPDYVKGGTATIIGNGVPWNAALRAVLASHDLDFRYTDNGRLVRVGTRHELMQEEREALDSH
ncbi:MAG TPA: efflux RND transporter periplasmic adaptor subunit [Kofleriaceae bacterium]|jgi:RND family efflux transporter MFP subunit